MGDELLKVKAGISAEGAEGELTLGAGLPAAVARFFPTWSLKVDVRRGIAAAILQKVGTGEPLSRADADYAAALFGEAEATWIRRKEIEARVARSLTTHPIALLPKGDTQDAANETKHTADEWVRRFWEDAGAISDEVLQEIYAQVLAGEIRRPASCSLRTLRALRYMDRNTANNFATLLRFTVSSDFLPRFARESLAYNVRADLHDAGLLDFRENVAKVFPNAGPFGWLCGPRAVEVSFDQFNEHSHPKLSCYLLTAAGRELAEVAAVKPTGDFADEFARDLLTLSGAPRVRIADLPHEHWNGHKSELTFSEVTPLPTPEP